MTDDTGWIPDACLPIAFKLARADELAWELFGLVFDGYARQQPIRLRARLEGERDYVTVEGVKPIPPVVPLVFGDAINQLRSSLDHALLALIEQARGHELPEDQARTIMFPITATETAFIRDMKRSGRVVPELATDTPLYEAIATLQPWHANQQEFLAEVPSAPFATALPPRDPIHPLVLLQRYSNYDKHRRIHFSSTRNAYLAIQAPPDRYRTHFTIDGEFSAGTDLVSVRQGDQVIIDFYPHIAVQRPDSDTWAPPVWDLHQIHQYLATHAHPTLICGHSNNGPLPPAIDLRSDFESPRRRLQLASQDDAFTRSSSSAMRAYLDQGFELP